MEPHTLRERRRALIEDDILQVAQELIAEKGYSTMSMEELAARVGISKPTLYGFFSTKADLVIAAIARGMERTLERVEHVAGQEGPPLDRLAAAMRTIVEQSQHGIAPSMTDMPEMKELMHDRAEVKLLKERMSDTIGTLVEQARREGQVADDLPTPIILQVFRGIVMSCFHPDPCDPLPQHTKGLAECLSTLFIRGIRAVKHS